jgi:hypothetical protein
MTHVIHVRCDLFNRVGGIIKRWNTTNNNELQIFLIFYYIYILYFNIFIKALGNLCFTTLITLAIVYEIWVIFSMPKK